jgi:hypothetical protein
MENNGMTLKEGNRITQEKKPVSNTILSTTNSTWIGLEANATFRV